MKLTQDILLNVAQGLNMSLDDKEVPTLIAEISGAFGAYFAPLDSLPDYLPEVEYPRTAGRRPSREEDPHNAWYYKTSVKGKNQGPLAGKTVVLKDTISLAGVPLMNGARSLEGYVPDIDATVVERLLDAGAEITGKANCEWYCSSGDSHTNALGYTINPHKDGHSAGGSSSGCGVIVATGQADMAIGGDQGGSVRVPSGYCGIYGMKPTYGLIPYTGAFATEHTLDHLGPMTANTEDNALLLSVLAGYDDELDPRQGRIETDDYMAHLNDGVNGMRIGIVTEGFGWGESNAVVDKKVKAAAAIFEKHGAEVVEISIPAHRTALQVWTPIIAEGCVQMMFKNNAIGNNWKGLYQTSLIEAQARWRDQVNDMPENLKLILLLGEYVNQAYRGHYYAKAQNLNRSLTKQYDLALESCDLLLMPTSPILPPALPPASPTREEMMGSGFTAIQNSAPFNCTGHPSMNVPCGMSDGLPIGMMLTANKFKEADIYRASKLFEEAVDWTRL